MDTSGRYHPSDRRSSTPALVFNRYVHCGLLPFSGPWAPSGLTQTLATYRTIRGYWWHRTNFQKEGRKKQEGGSRRQEAGRMEREEGGGKREGKARERATETPRRRSSSSDPDSPPLDGASFLAASCVSRHPHPHPHPHHPPLLSPPATQNHHLHRYMRVVLPPRNVLAGVRYASHIFSLHRIVNRPQRASIRPIGSSRRLI